MGGTQEIAQGLAQEESRVPRPSFGSAAAAAAAALFFINVTPPKSVVFRSPKWFVFRRNCARWLGRPVIIPSHCPECCDSVSVAVVAERPVECHKRQTKCG